MNQKNVQIKIMALNIIINPKLDLKMKASWGVFIHKIRPLHKICVVKYITHNL